METSLKSLITKRGSLKAQLTLFETFLSNLENAQFTEKDFLMLENRLSRIESLLDLFIEINTEITCLQENEENTVELGNFQDKYFNVVANAKAMLIKHKSLDNQSTGGSCRSNDLNEPRNINNVKLPTVSLPSYDGTFTQWREFKDKFGSLIDKDHSLTNAQKLSYLKSALKGEAAELISALETTNDNYSIAWGRLEKRYNNKRRIVNNHVQTILDIGNTTRESYQSLRNLINTTQNHLDCLKTFAVPVDSWDALLIPILVSKLDSQTNKEWEAKLNKENDTKDRIPTIDEFLDFLSVKQSTLETTHNRIANKSDQINKVNKYMREVKTLAAITVSCDYCQQEHLLQHCEGFLRLSTTDRNSKIRELKLCINCFRKGHFVQNCHSSNSCRKCKKRHHTLLHMQTSQAEQRGEQTVVNCINNELSPSQVLLSTARVLAIDKLSQPQEIRVLLDSASQSNFITTSLCKQLKLKPERINISVKGINHGSTVINQRVNVSIQSKHNNFSTVLTCLVIPEITPNLPAQSLRVETFKVPPHIKLADSTFWKSGPIDMLIGANLFYELLCVGQTKEKNSPVLQKTKLGWVVSGSFSQSNTTKGNVESVTYLTLNELHKSVEKFWNADEFESKERKLSIEEQYCEENFKATTTRDPSGKFIVRIPLRKNLDHLGDSTAIAKSRFYAIERRLNRNVSLKQQYTTFMNDYISLHHMTKSENATEAGFYLPHHPVINNMSETTKLRVVFDGSCNLDYGLSINETQCVGPTIQEELVSIIARFRTYTYVITADITKMYRQVWVHASDRKYQRIFWRADINDDLQSYELNTVTYGTSAAPYLAIRALIQLSVDNERIHPTEARVIRHDFYVDDLLTGSDSVEELRNIKGTVSNILSTGGFDLRKWVSNVSELSDEQIGRDSSVPLTEKIHKTLGIYWNSNTDTFSYSIMQLKTPIQITKRTILAATSQLFDPLGLLSPIIILARLIIQDLWKSNVDWDETIPRDVYSRWLTFRDQLKAINKIQIPRHAILHQSQTIELHAFSDASERGYGACLYLRSTNAIGETKVCLLAAKSRVAPTKFVTLPRLELCAAVLSAQLVNKFKPSLNISITREYFWRDSQVVLGWINSNANNYNTYVANRITEIQSLTIKENWYYVKSKENPADLISRGVLPNCLTNLSLWWQGRFWLFEPIQNQITCNDVDSQFDLPEQKKNIQVFAITTRDDPFLIKNYSSLSKLVRIVAYILRFIHNCSIKSKERNKGSLTTIEQEEALMQLVKIAQREVFAEELSNLTNKVPIGNKSKILSLSPFIDSLGLLRVGGRIQLSEFAYDKRHPILLPKNHHLTILIFRNEHISLLHGGAKILLNTVREKFWAINGLNTAKKTVRECVKCVRFQRQVNDQLMGTLPRERLLAMHPFHSTGLDYGGPFFIKDRKGRGSKVSKAYLCLFICFSTKSIHLELVSELSTTAFLATLRRFIARRGKPLHIFSDNGTNFVGANRELERLGNFLQDQSSDIQTNSSKLGIQWHFIPPYAPNFGGLWEAGIKSTKHYLKRVLNETPLTYEEFSTLLCQIESILNSRPLTTLTSDPSDIEALTPAHFLIGRQFTTIPDPNVQDISITRLNRFELVQKVTQNFWDRWSKHYIAELQQRQSWKRSSPPPQVGTMVLIKQENVPPSRWQLGRIIEVHPGIDKLVRVVTVKCASGDIKRSVSKIVVLPVSASDIN